VSLNTDGSSLLLVGSHNLSVLYVHERVSEDGDTIICRYISAPLWILSCIDDIHFFLHFLTHYLSCKTKIATKSMGKHFPDVPLVVHLKIIFLLDTVIARLLIIGEGAPKVCILVPYRIMSCFTIS
jgi:hypothetical protein